MLRNEKNASVSEMLLRFSSSSDLSRKRDESLFVRIVFMVIEVLYYLAP